MDGLLKSDFHIHANFDMGKKVLHYKLNELIDFCAKSGYEVLCVTNHDKLMFNKLIQNYAKKKGILLIPGCEKTIEGKHVLLINVSRELLEKINTFDDLEKYKDENIVVIAPHPFFPGTISIGKKLEEHKGLFDAIEYSHFYLKHLNFNKKAVKFAKQNRITLVGTSDAHHFSQLNKTYSLLDCNKKIDDVLEAIRKGDVKLKTQPITLPHAIKIAFNLAIHNRFRKFYK